MHGQSFGYWLKRQRKALDLTQAELASQVFCSAATIRKVEAGERHPSEQIAERLAEIFKIPKNERSAFLQFARSDQEAALHESIENGSWHTTISVARANLPVPLTSFIGRKNEVEEIVRLVGQNRLLTLTGPGGVGKTRLAIQSSKKVLSQFKDGVWWVELTSLADGTLVPQALAKSLGVREMPDQTLDQTLSNFLQMKQSLLVLDNCEHLIAGCAQLADMLLGSSPTLKILATSREALGLPNEVIWTVPNLSFPSIRSTSPVDFFMQYEGIHLFVERASVVDPSFKLTEQNAPLVAQICQRVDGMPLAIELAAARVKMMTVAEIAIHLDNRFDLLTAGSRTALPRHQTLRAAIDWSYDLLSASEQVFFKRLSVFAGGFKLDAAENIAIGGDISKSQAIDLLGQLINKSLVTVHARKDGSETRYGMLETIREYAREKLEASGETEEVHRRHCDFFVAFAEQAEPKLKDAQQLEWLDRLEVEHDNLRVILQRTHEAGEAGTMLRLAETLSWFWNRRSYLSEGRRWLERALVTLDASVATSIRAKGLYAAASITRAQGDFTKARELVEKSIVLWQTLGPTNQYGLSRALVLLGDLMRDEGDPAAARAVIEEAVAFFREQDDAWGTAESLMSLGMAIRDQEDYGLAWSTIQESVALWRQQGDLFGLADALHRLGLVAYRQGDYETAYSLMDEALRIRRRLGDKYAIAYSIHNLGVFTLAQGNIDRARAFFDQDLVMFRDVGDKSGEALSLQYQGLFAYLEGDEKQAQLFLEQGLKLARETGPRWVSSNYLLWLAGVAANRGDFERVVRLCSAAKAHLMGSASFWDAYERSQYERIIDLARVSLDENAFALAQSEGRAMTLEQAIAYALENSK